MKSRRRFVDVAILVLVLSIFIYYRLTNIHVDEVVGKKASLKEHHILDFDIPRSFNLPVLVDHNNDPFTQDRILNKWTLMYFGHPLSVDVCPLVLARLNLLLQKISKKNKSIAKNVEVVLVTSYENNEDKKEIKDYVQFFNPSFVGVLGQQSEVTKLMKNLRLNYKPHQTGEDAYIAPHSANVVIINPKGYYHGFIKPLFDVDNVLDGFMILAETLNSR